MIHKTDEQISVKCSYCFCIVVESLVPSEEFQTVSDVKTLTAKLYSQLNVDEFQLKKEQEIIKQLEDYQFQIAPFEKVSRGN